MRQRIGTKLISALLIGAAITMLVGAVAVFALARVNNSTSTILDIHLKEMDSVQRLQTTMAKAAHYETEFVLFSQVGDLAKREEYRVKLEDAWATLVQNAEAFRSLPPGSELREHADELGQLVAQSSEKLTVVKNLMLAGRSYAEVQPQYLEYISTVDTLEDVTGHIYQHSNELMLERQEGLVQLQVTLKNFMIATVVVAVILALFLGMTLTRSITRPVSRLSGVTKKITAGDLTQRAEVTSTDELGELATSFNQMTESLQKSRDEIKEKNRELEGIMQNVIDGIGVSNVQGELIQANRALAEMHGYDSPDEVIGRPFFDFVAKEDLPRIAERFQEITVNKEKTVKDFEMIGLKKDGSKFPEMINIANSWDKDGSLTRSFVVASDITERKRVEHDLGERVKELNCLYGIGKIAEKQDITLDELYREVANLLPAGWQYPEITCARITINGNQFETENYRDSPWRQSSAIEVNGVRTGVVEVSYLEERPEIDEGPFLKEERLLIDAVAEQLGRIIERKRAEREIQERNEQLDAQNEELEDRVRERTAELETANKELRETQEQLVRSERLAAIGQLAGGVGHELRNPLGAIKNAVYYIKGKVVKSELAEKEPRVTEFLDIMDEEINSSNKIINDLLGFSRVGKPSVSPTHIESVVEEALSHTPIPKNIELVKRLDADLLEVEVDTGQIQQVLVNMIANAVETMPEGGKLTIAARQRDKFLEVEIADTGGGIPEEAISKIFDPLFTTKAKGIGLGLALCKAIIERHGGSIEVKSEAGRGATFTIKLPLKAKKAV